MRMGWPSTSRLSLRPAQSVWSAGTSSPPPPPSYEPELFDLKPVTQSHPAARYPDRPRIGHKEYPLVVKRLVRSPFNGSDRKADAVYYDDEVGQWRKVVNETDRLTLARAVEEGRVRLVDPAYWPT